MRAIISGLLLASLIGGPAVAGFPTGNCIGDCSGDGEVTVDEIIVGVRIALDELPRTACPNGGPGINVSGLVTAVRLALEGCSAVRDFSDFSHFALSRGSGLGFCPMPGVYRTALEQADGGIRFTRSILVPGTPGVDLCLNGIYGTDCLSVRPDADRLLTPDETAQVRAAFAAVALFNGPDPFCVYGFVDPCVITSFVWDDAWASDFACTAPRVTGEQQARLESLLASFPASASPGTCGNGALDAGEACDASRRDRLEALACARNCTPALLHECRLDSARSEIRLVDGALTLSAPLSGQQSIAVGARRPAPFVGAGADFAAAQVPVEVPRDFFAIAPARLPGIGCLCLAPAPADVVAGAGTIDCHTVVGFPGTALIGYALTLTTLEDGGRCAPARDGAGTCPVADYGADCAPCTADDHGSTLPLNIGLTTHALYDEAFSENGAPFDCEALASPPSSGPGTAGAGLVGAFATAAGGRGLLRLTCE
jgi:hypothetical protein